MNTIKILGKEYEILDTLEYITLADSFVKNKIGSGHGEAKLYVGNESDKIFSFFENMTDLSCFFIKKDFKKFLEDAQEEYLKPQQEYLKKDELPSKFQDLKEKLNNFAIEKLEFKLTRVNVNPPRVYMNSESVYYNFMRDVALPNISYLSILKIKDNSSNIFYYFRIFIDYRTDIIGYKTLEEERQEAMLHQANTAIRKARRRNK